MLIIFLFVVFAQAPAARVDQLQWIAGCWTMMSGGGVIEEQWMAPSGGTMLGMSRTVRGGKTTEYEYLQIREEGAGLVYDARPAGQTPTIFPLRDITADRVTFENPTHDFPQRIIYRKIGDDALTA